MIIGLNKLVAVEVKDEFVKKFPFPRRRAYFGFIRHDGQIVPIALTAKSVLVNNLCQSECMFECKDEGLQIVRVGDGYQRKLLCRIKDDVRGERNVVINFSDSLFEKAKKTAQFFLKNSALLREPRLSIFAKISVFFSR